MASIARKNLLEDIPRFLVAQAGIMFAVSLVTIQTGILDGFSRSTTRLIDQSSADIWVAANDMLHVEITSSLPLERLAQARKVPGVEKAEALSIVGTRWHSPSEQLDTVRIYAFNPDGELFTGWKVVQGQLSDLKKPYTMFVDKANLHSLGLNQLGAVGHISSLPATLVGLTEDTQSMASSLYLFTSLETANAYLKASLTSNVNCRWQNGDLQCLSSFTESTPRKTTPPPAPPERLSLSDSITYVLVKASPGQDIQELRRKLEAACPDTHAYTKAEIATITRTYWQDRTGVGFILGLGAAVGFVVGIVVVSQILYASVSDHLKEFGTLKAMGASDWVIYRVITEQALWMAVLGYVPSMALCLALGRWTMAAKGIMILITPATAASVFGITIVMCIGSAVFAIQKVTHVDPAIVFKA
jgi:putative ABC transport system permease protein